MNYELAEELELAGFQKPTKYEGHMLYKSDIEETYAPTLSELIEACGDRFEELNRVGHHKKPRWIVSSFPCEECGWKDMHTIGGETPEEAVAKLWLALHPLP